jgi:cell division protein FtsB
MLDFQQKRKLRNILYNHWFLGVLCLLVILSIHSIWSVYRKQIESENLLQLAKAQETELQDREKELRQKIDDLKTPQGLEAEIRSKFNVAKPDESVVVVLESTSTDSVATSTMSFWRKFFDFFR